MKHHKFSVLSLILAFVLVMIAGTTGSAATPADSKIREAIDRTQAVQAAISRCLSADDKVCAEGLELAKSAKALTERAMDQSELKDAAKSYLRTALEQLSALNYLFSNARVSEALPVANNALNALYEADKVS